MSIPHVSVLDLFNNGVVYEVVIMKVDKANGDIYFIRTDYLDQIDYQRVGMILSRRDAARYEAWDLFGQITLANGVNALEYFHQFVKVKTRSGEIMTPNLRRAGAAGGAPKLLNAQSFADAAKHAQQQQTIDTPLQHQEAPRKAGRPPKANKS